MPRHGRGSTSLYRLFEFRQEPKLFLLPGDIERHVQVAGRQLPRPLVSSDPPTRRYTRQSRPGPRVIPPLEGADDRTRKGQHPLRAEVLSTSEVRETSGCHHCGAPLGVQSSTFVVSGPGGTGLQRRLPHRGRDHRRRQARRLVRPPHPLRSPGRHHRRPPPSGRGWTHGASRKSRRPCCGVGTKGARMTTTPAPRPAAAAEPLPPPPPSPSQSKACAAPAAPGSSSASSPRSRG